MISSHSKFESVSARAAIERRIELISLNLGASSPLELPVFPTPFAWPLADGQSFSFSAQQPQPS
jgi:hypothetical protein